MTYSRKRDICRTGPWHRSGGHRSIPDKCGAHTALYDHIVARPVRKKTNWVFAVGRLTACDALAASLCGLVVRVGECGEVSKACAVQRAASAVVSSSPFVQQASLGSSSGGWMTPAAGWNLSRPHNGRQWLNRSVLTYSRAAVSACPLPPTSLPPPTTPPPSLPLSP